jgi:hypothetical protein
MTDTEVYSSLGLVRQDSPADPLLKDNDIEVICKSRKKTTGLYPFTLHTEPEIGRLLIQ